MSNDDRQHQMDFILQQQAAFSSDMVELKNSLSQIGEAVRQQGENIDKLAGVVANLAETVEAHRQETQDSISNLIVANEATRDLANKAAQLAINVSQRLTRHEQQPHEQAD